MGREDGSLVLAKRLLWERRPHYALNISVTDGLHVVYTVVSTPIATNKVVVLHTVYLEALLIVKSLMLFTKRIEFLNVTLFAYRK